MPDLEQTSAPPAKAPWRTIYFRLEAPEAREVSVVGDFNGWDAAKHPMSRNPSGVWETSCPLPPGRHAYAFVVDGTRQPDPNCPERADTGEGECRCVVTVTPPEGG